MQLSEKTGKLFKNAAVHDHRNAGRFRFLSGRIVDNAFLHPDAARALLKRVVDYFRNFFGPAKNVRRYRHRPARPASDG